MTFAVIFNLMVVASVASAIIPLTRIGYVTYNTPLHQLPLAHIQPQQAVANEYDPHPQYNYEYKVQDLVSGDSKGQIESRDGDVVKGEYSLIDADGFKRTVLYVADPVNGFNAIVNREPIGVAPATVRGVMHTPQLLYSLARSGESAYVNGPVVKGAYAESPIVKAAPVAYPL